ncbi:glycogen debranching N-terminal domain-containing protein [Methylobacterium oryzae CBMB20]
MRRPGPRRAPEAWRTVSRTPTTSFRPTTSRPRPPWWSGPLRSLKFGEAFGVLDSYGDIGVQPGPEGLYFQDTRYLSRLEVTVEGQRPLMLSSVMQDDNGALSVDMTTPDIRIDAHDETSIPRETIAIERTKFLFRGACYDRIGLRSYDSKHRRLRIAVTFDADFRDLFEVRGTDRKRARQARRPGGERPRSAVPLRRPRRDRPDDVPAFRPETRSRSSPARRCSTCRCRRDGRDLPVHPGDLRGAPGLHQAADRHDGRRGRGRQADARGQCRRCPPRSRRISARARSSPAPTAISRRDLQDAHRGDHHDHLVERSVQRGPVPGHGRPLHAGEPHPRGHLPLRGHPLVLHGVRARRHHHGDDGPLDRPEIRPRRAPLLSPRPRPRRSTRPPTRSPARSSTRPGAARWRCSARCRSGTITAPSTARRSS